MPTSIITYVQINTSGARPACLHSAASHHCSISRKLTPVYKTAVLYIGVSYLKRRCSTAALGATLDACHMMHCRGTSVLWA